MNLLKVHKKLLFILLLIWEGICSSEGQADSIKLRSTYDYIIVGAGSAGSVVANRLSAVLQSNVLLLEAGGEVDPIMNSIPVLAPSIKTSKQDWNFLTVPQTSPFLVGTRTVFDYPRGKVLGGTSSINYMVYARGNRRDYEEWNRQAGGNWNWTNDVLPAFLKSENVIGFHGMNQNFHNRGGYLGVSQSNFQGSFADEIIAAGKDVGLQNNDYNGQNQTGISSSQNTIYNGVRSSTYRAFIEPIRNRPNLQIITEAHVVKVLFTDVATKNGMFKTTGVEFMHNGKKLKAFVNKEVILSAGTFFSPHLLMLSGVGPRALLNKFNIPVIVDLPGVGQNLHEHLYTHVAMYVKDMSKEDELKCLERQDSNDDLVNWAFHKIGPLTNPMVNVEAFLKSPAADPRDDWPDIQGSFRVPFEFHPPDETAFPNKKYWGIQCNASPMRPKSRGFITLQSGNPMDLPLIDPKYFSNKDDIKLFLDGARWCLNMNNTKTFRKEGIRMEPTAIAKCGEFDIASDKFVRCIALTDAYTGGHVAGTCKMGKKTDKKAVVDSELRVLKVEGLRVVDASIMPTPTTGNTNAPTIMIGERGAKFILRS